MSAYLVLFLLGLILAIMSTPLFIRWLNKHQLVAHPSRDRDVHRHPIPRFGGVVIGIVIWTLVAAVLVVRPDLLSFVSDRLFGIDRNLVGVLLGSFIVVAAGVYDDWHDMQPGWKLFWQFVAASMLPLFGVKMQWLTNPMETLGIIELTPLIDSLIVIGWTVAIMNVVNFLDGLDGLASGVSTITAVILFTLALQFHQPALAVLLAMVIGTLGGFLTWNWYPAKIFLGDSGSQLLGFLLATGAIISGGKLATAALVLSLPILDALWAVIRRLVGRRSPFAGDRYHLHHRLLDLGVSQPQVVVILMTISGIFGMIALASHTSGKMQTLVGAVILMVVLLGSIAFIERSRRMGRAR